MAESKRPNYRTKGAILIMVLTIMFVLIIMLVATLSVVSTAKRRTYTSFEENQASFTSRSAIEFFIKDLSNNNDDPATTMDHYWAGSAATMTFAREIEMDIRTLPSIDEDNSMAPGWTAPAGYDTTVYNYNDNNLDALYVSDGSAKLPAPYNKYSTETMLKYEVTLPKADSGSNAYGKFADSDQKVIVTVEVLDRYFDLGEDPSFPGDVTKYSVKFGSRQKDIVKLRITSTAVFDDYEATTVIIVNSAEPTVPNEFNKGICATGTATAVTKIYAFGGMASNNNYTMSDNKIFDSFYLSKDLTITSSGDLDLASGCYIATKGNINWTSSMKLKTVDDKSFIYCGGIFSLTNTNIGVATPTPIPVDIICNGGNISSGNIVGNIYCDGDLTLGNVMICGNVFVTGTLFLDNTKITGSDSSGWTYLPGTPGSTGGQKINGNVYANHITSSTSTLFPDATNVILGCPNTVQLEYYPDPSITALPSAVGDKSAYYNNSITGMDKSRIVEDSGSRMIKLTLPTDNIPWTPTSTNKKEYRIPTFEYEYPAYLDVDDYKPGGIQVGYEIKDTVYAFEKYNKDTKSTETNLKLYNPNDPTQQAGINTATKQIFSSGWLPDKPSLTESSYNGYTVMSGITLQFVDQKTYDGKLIMSDDSDDTIFIVPEGANVTLRMQILSRELATILNTIPGENNQNYKDNIIYSGTQTDKSKLCKPPRINMYVGEGAIINIHTTGSERGLLNGYVYGPLAKLNVLANGLPNVKVNYNGVNQNCNCIAVGAIVFEDITGASGVDSAVVYIDKDTDYEPDHGHSLVNWSPGYYTNDVNYTT